jgi:hypothetical protein
MKQQQELHCLLHENLLFILCQLVEVKQHWWFINHCCVHTFLVHADYIPPANQTILLRFWVVAQATATSKSRISTCTSPSTKSGTNSSLIKNSSTGGTQSSLAQISLKLSMLIRELIAPGHSSPAA